MIVERHDIEMTQLHMLFWGCTTVSGVSCICSNSGGCTTIFSSFKGRRSGYLIPQLGSSDKAINHAIKNRPSEIQKDCWREKLACAKP